MNVKDALEGEALSVAVLLCWIYCAILLGQYELVLSNLSAEAICNSEAHEYHYPMLSNGLFEDTLSDFDDACQCFAAGTGHELTMGRTSNPTSPLPTLTVKGAMPSSWSTGRKSLLPNMLIRIYNKAPHT